MPTDLLRITWRPCTRTNQFAVITPYEVAFHCFSGELAAVLSSFAADPHGFVVRGVNVEPGVTAEATSGNGREHDARDVDGSCSTDDGVGGHDRRTRVHCRS